MMPASQTTNQTELDFSHREGTTKIRESRPGAENLGIGRQRRRDLEEWLLNYRGPEPGSPYGADRPEYYKDLPF